MSMVSWSLSKVFHISVCSADQGGLDCEIILSFKPIENFFSFTSSLIGNIS